MAAEGGIENGGRVARWDAWNGGGVAEWKWVEWRVG